MEATFLIALREGLEAALIVGIVYSILRRVGQERQRGALWAGVGAAVVLSVAAGLLLNRLGVELEGRGEQVFEGMTMLLAAVVLTWMIFFMQRQGRQVQTSLEAEAQRSLAKGGGGAIFTLAFVAVLREGIETALFLTAASFGARPGPALLGGLLGLAAAIALGVLLFAGSRRLNLRLFFRVTGILLLLFAAGLASRAVHEFQESGLLPVTIEHVWNTGAIISEDSPLGSFLVALLGYSASPSLLQVIVYAAYLAVVGLFSWWPRPAKQATEQDDARASRQCLAEKHRV